MDDSKSTTKAAGVKPEQFAGFEEPVSNWHRMPNEWTNITAGIASLAELKVVEYVLRHTWGFQEYGVAKAISTDEFCHGRKRANGERMDKGTGLSNHSVIDGLRRAVKDGLLVVDVDGTDKARLRKSYALRMRTQEDAASQGCSKFTPDVKNLHSSYEQCSHRTEKDTLERHKEKERQTGDAPLVHGENSNGLREALANRLGIEDPALSELALREDITDSVIDAWAGYLREHPEYGPGFCISFLRRGGNAMWPPSGRRQGRAMPGDRPQPREAYGEILGRRDNDSFANRVARQKARAATVVAEAV